MSFVEPPVGRPALAERLAAHVFLSTSPDVPVSAVDYWELSHAAYRRVHGWIGALLPTYPGLEEPLRDLERDPDDVTAHRTLAAALSDALEEAPALEAEACELVAEADAEIWIDYWLGGEHRGAGDAPHYDTELLRTLPRKSRPEGAVPRVQIIIPVRDPELGPRTRNLLACLHALHDQDHAEGATRIMVVETDRSPHVRDLVEPLVDEYVFAYKDGLFNK
jgi:hypothetical protein